MNLRSFGQTFESSETKDYFMRSVSIHVVFSLKKIRKMMAEERVVFDGCEGENEEFLGFDLENIK